MASISFRGGNYGMQIGENSGSVHAEFHPPHRPETPPGPLSNVPFPRDPDFVRHDTLLEQVHNKSLAPGARIALVGLGGVGKSQLAIEYTYQVRCESPGTWIFWLHASNETRFEQSFREIADELKLPGRQDPGVNIFQLVENWLRDETKGRWICVIDNVDDDFVCSIPTARKENETKVPTNTPTKPLVEYLPRRPHGFTIITSRNREIALKMVNDADLIHVQPMARSEALELFQKKMDRPEDTCSEESQQLVEMLEYMPLAIVQAASYIRNRAPRCSVAQYLRDFRKDRQATELLREEVRYTYRDWEAKNSILMTWQTSFKYIREMRPSAADLLSLMSFCDRQGIPENLVRPHSPNTAISPEEIGSNSSDSELSKSDFCVDFEHDVNTLRDFSFISASENGSSFMMHRLVQLSTRAWLKSHGEEDQWQERFIMNLAKEFPSGDYGTWEQCQALYPHVKSAMLQWPKSHECQTQLSGLLCNGAWYTHRLGLFGDMEEMALKSKEQAVKLFGHRNKMALRSTSMLAMAYKNQGRWEEAEQLGVQVMETYKSKLGEDHPDTLISMGNLASTYRHQGRWEEAEQLEVQVIETHKIKLGEDHPDTLSSMNNLAFTLWSTGQTKRALFLMTKCARMSEQKLGRDHPRTKSSRSTMEKWHGKEISTSSSSQLPQATTESKKNQMLSNCPEISEPVLRQDGRRRRTILSRLFRKK
ncbi:hypothetical protein N7454_005296 [Penicillium verhagenii]|nr:hypothetical protein N7454_005296 [Penicillium verhagenii]